MVRATHLLFGVALTAAIVRALSQGWLDAAVDDPGAVAAARVGLALAGGAASALGLAAGIVSHAPRLSLRDDVLSSIALFTAMFLVALGWLPRDAIGLVLILVMVARFAPLVWWIMRRGAPSWFIYALTVAGYLPLAGWRVAASLPFGDQVFYLLSADRLAHGSLDATIDPNRFFDLLGVAPQAIDTATHVASSPVGPRLVQGYALPALILPGWVVGAEVGATIVIALFAAWAATQTWLILSETVGDSRVARATWALTAFCAPLALAAVHVYPNAVGAALVATGFRFAFTTRHRRALLAGVLLGATAFLNPRDGLVFAALAPFVIAWPRVERVRFAIGAVAAIAVAAVVSLMSFGIPLPYAGYLFGTAAAQTIQPEPTWTFRFWIGLPAILFDRVFGIAGTAPWILLAFLGLPRGLADRARLLPAAVAVGASLVVLSLFRLWEGGYAPPNRYIVDVLPLIAPFVALGLREARTLLLRAVAAVAIGTSLLVTALLLAVPSAALNSAFEDKPQQLLATALGIDPLGWLPSFQPVTPDWWIAAYLRLVPAVAIVALLVWSGRRRARA